jgi:hypothetical protein
MREKESQPEGENLRLHVQNTFLHVKDEDVEATRLSRSWSDSSLCSSSRKSGFSREDLEAPLSGSERLDMNRSPSPSKQVAFASTGSHSQDSHSQENSIDSSSMSGASCSLEEGITGGSLVKSDRRGWSAGSDKHNLNQCNPCAWNWRPPGCVNGTSCLFCHMCPEGALKSRRKERVAMIKAERSMNRTSQSSGVASRSAPLTMYVQPLQHPNSDQCLADPSTGISNMSSHNSIRVPQRMTKLSL